MVEAEEFSGMPDITYTLILNGIQGISVLRRYEVVSVLATLPNAKELALASLNRLPPFSPVLNRLLATLAHEDVSFAKVADMLEKDVVLAGNVLGLVNSALYGRRERVNSVRHAVSLLGVNKLRNAALGMSITRLWGKVRTPPGWSMASFNQHSIAAAILSDLLSQEVAVVYPEGAFVAGLLHDFGLLLLAVGLPDAYGQIERVCERDNLTVIEAEMRVLGLTHAELSAEVLQVWKLPEPIQVAVQYYLDPSDDVTSTGPGQHSLSKILNLADAYVNRMKICIASKIPLPECDIEMRVAELGIESELPRIIADFRKEYDAVKDVI